jgi:hypothetical protein
MGGKHHARYSSTLSSTSELDVVGGKHHARYSSTLSSTSELDVVDGKHHAPAVLPPRDPDPILQEVEWVPGPVSRYTDKFNFDLRP